MWHPLRHKAERVEPWNFEAGAFSKTLTKAYVCPLLLDLRPSDLDRRSPLLQFQAAVFERGDMLRLLQTVHAAAGAGVPHLERQFDMWWPRETNLQPSMADRI